MKLATLVFIAFLSMTLTGCKTGLSTGMDSDSKSLGSDARPAIDQDAPYIECADNVDKEILLSSAPDKSLFLYSSATANAQSFSNKIAQTLNSPGVQRAMIFDNMGKDCQMINRSTTTGIEQIDCNLQRGAHLKFVYENNGKYDFWIAKGTLHFYRNIYYGGTAQISLDITTTGGRSASVTKLLKHDDCKVVGLSK